MKYCGVATPFRGVRAYTRCAMGMPGSETALEELMCRVLGDCLQDGIAAKLADDLYCGADTPKELLQNWQQILDSLQRCNLHMSASKTTICPQSTPPSLDGSGHKASCLPANIALLLFLRVHRQTLSVAYAHLLAHTKLLAVSFQTAPNSSHHLIRSYQAKNPVTLYSGQILHLYTSNAAQNALKEHKSITLPRPSDQLWIVTDGSVAKSGIGATLYVNRE